MRISLAPILLLAASVRAAKVYDYVVIGGGTAGLTVASRLSENPDVTVAVLEAGFNAEGLQEVFVPGLIGSGISFTTLDWNYATVPQRHLNNRVLNVNAGKGLGGSTLINSMIFPRAEKEQYDAWGQLNSDPSWTWTSLLPFFKKSELFTPPNAFQTAAGATFLPSVHGFSSSGRVKVGFPNFFYEQSRLWRESVVGMLGFPKAVDLSNGDPHAVGIAPNSLDARNNTRCSAACAYYTPFASRPNLAVFTNATVSRIIWAVPKKPGDNLIASAVEYISSDTNQTLTVGVGKEVIVSAGTIGSPKVLELSGVGNSTILKAAGVTPVLDLPSVGENLAGTWANAFTNVTLTKDALLLNPDFAAAQLQQWFKNRTGGSLSSHGYTTPTFWHSGLFSAAPRSLTIAAPSDVFSPGQLAALVSQAEANLTRFAQEFSNGNTALAKGIAAQHKIALELYKRDKELPLEMNVEPGYSGPTPFALRPRRNYTTINTVLYAPLSRGRTHITSASPHTPPAVDPAYYAHPLDVAAHGEFEPGVEKTGDKEIEDWLRGVVASDNHEVGSASMMPRALGGVVDTRLRVYGTGNVRVADASIIPFPVSAHLSSTIYMIGERAADIIQRDAHEL
ncbi:Alcohol oxidase [Mycena kentingensis (nom. inval.)]|nr:Alcohol oxidase [Mycena kentingensis (nom. inval.)]